MTQHTAITDQEIKEAIHAAFKSFNFGPPGSPKQSTAWDFMQELGRIAQQERSEPARILYCMLPTHIENSMIQELNKDAPRENASANIQAHIKQKLHTYFTRLTAMAYTPGSLDDQTTREAIDNASLRAALRDWNSVATPKGENPELARQINTILSNFATKLAVSRGTPSLSMAR